MILNKIKKYYNNCHYQLFSDLYAYVFSVFRKLNQHQEKDRGADHKSLYICYSLFYVMNSMKTPEEVKYFGQLEIIWGAFMQ